MQRCNLLLIAILTSFSTAITAGSDLPDYKADKIAPHTWVIHGPIGLPNPENKGFMNNPAFTITDKSVVVFDPGSSKQAGEMVLRQINKLTKKPVTHVFSSHIHGDHWLGNQAIKTAYPNVNIYAHPEMIKQANDGEADSWVSFMEQVTEGATKGTQAVIPGEALKDKQEVVVDGMVFRAYLTDHAHTKTDAMIEIVSDRVLVTGDNVLNQRIGRMDDGSFRGNIEACEIAKATPVKTFIPGHGPSGDAASTLSFCDYLNILYSEVGVQVEEGLSDFEMKPLIMKKLTAYEKWNGFEGEFGKHISLAMLEYETASFE
jgi:glyoxylase-like metal-dependent hydrolase (beta-lactamase superfamily II)